MKRESIKNELMAKALSYFENLDQYDMVYEDKERNYTAYQAFDENNNVVTIIDWYCPGFTEEHWQRWSTNPSGINAEMNARFTTRLVNEDGGYKTYFEQMKFPLFVSNRYVVTTFYYDEDKETGWRSSIDSGKGDEAIEASLKEEIGSDVRAFIGFNIA